jgi:hypothetical protein
MPNFTDLIRMLADGEQVTAGTANRPLRALDQNIRYLKELFETTVRGESTVALGRLVKSDVLESMPVFYNSITQQFEKALGAAEQDEDTGAFITSNSTQVWGIVLEKHSATSADILLHGMAEIDLTNAVSGDIDAGVYYLSNSIAGKLVTQRPPVGVTVLQAGPELPSGKHLVFVNTHFHDLLEAHKHYKFTLSAMPAGSTTPPAEGEIHEITAADSDIEGWLPADDAVFGGNAPEGAKFGYNIAASRLNSLWPPQPLDGAYVELYPGGEDLGSAVPMGEGELLIADRHGIWWMSNCYSHVPWDTDLDTDVSESEPEDCPPHGERKLIIWLTRPVFANTGTWVSSLRARDGSGLVVTCVDNGDPATVGDLVIDLDLSLTIGDTDTAGHLAFKGLGDDKKFKLGPIAESIKSGSNNVNLSSDVDPVSGKYYGNVVVSVDQDLNAGELGIDLARLNGVDEEYFSSVTGLGFVAGRNGSVRWRLNIPTGIDLPDGAQVKFVFWVLNRSNADIPAEIFNASYRRISYPGSTPTALPLDASEVALANIPAENISIGSVANKYVAIETEPFEIASGEQILLEFGRNGATDSFNADLFVIRQYGMYVTE